MADEEPRSEPAGEPRYVAVALGLGLAGTSFAFAPLGSYTFPLALGAAGLGLLAPDLMRDRSRIGIGGATLAALVACVLALVVALFG